MTETKARKYFLFQLAFFGAAVVINFVLPRTASYFHIPLYLDNVGTLLAAVLGGYLPGIFVGYLNNIINMQGNPGNAYYVVLSTMIAAMGSYLGMKGYFKKFTKALITIPVFAFIGGVLGSILTFLLYGYGMGEGISAPFARALLDNGTLNVFWAQMVSDIVIDLIDKAITVILVFFSSGSYLKTSGPIYGLPAGGRLLCPRRHASKQEKMRPDLFPSGPRS